MARTKPVSVKVGNRRLLKLAAFLRTIPRKRFDYRSWVGRDWEGDVNLSCGTTACALGWATTIPGFRRLGLRLVSIPGPFGDNGEVVLKTRRTTNLDAAVMLFGLTKTEAYHLFVPEVKGADANATPKQVARKIERFVKGRR